MSAGDGIEVTRGREELLETARPLWLALRDHHHAVAPDMGPVRSDDETWARRRAAYAEWLAEDARAFFLIARRAGRVIAYAFVRPVLRNSNTWVEDDVPALEVETLSVAPEARGTGVGARLMALIREEHDRGGYGGLSLVAIAQNRDALRFYEREGFAPAFIILRDSPRRP